MRLVMIGVAMAVMLCVGVFIGIDSAEKNIQKLQGAEGAPRAIQITPQDGKVEIAVLGQVMKAENPVNRENQQQIVDMKKNMQTHVQNHTNYLAQMGNSMGTGIRETTRSLLDSAFFWMK